MAVERFDVLVRDQVTRHELKRQWTKPELMKSIPWLKRMNARGSDVYLRPAGQHGLVLIDGLKAENLTTMRNKGFEPAVVVESNPGMYQAWVALSASPVTDHVRQLAGEGLAHAFGRSLPDSPGSGFGRLAGFTFDEGKGDRVMKRRYALAHEGKSTVASNGEKLLAHVESKRRAVEAELERKRAAERQHGKHLGRSR